MSCTTTTPDAVRVQPACHVRRCIAPAAWRLAVMDDGATVTANTYCATHAAQHVAALPRAGRRLTLDALVEGVAE